MSRQALHQLVQIEIGVEDVKASLAFYKEVFGWTLSPCEIQNYLVLDVPENCPYGIALVKAKKTAHSCITLYFQTDEPAEVLKRVESSGGTTIFGPKWVPPYGEIFQFKDINGIRWGLYKN